ncbi:unnamed protein product [Amaranthus hypochondriacus]
MAREWLYDIFAKFGRVHDFYISKKIRITNKDAFAFVRYSKRVDAISAINKLDGLMVKVKMMKVLMAKFNKGGNLISKNPGVMKNSHPKNQTIKFPAFRDNRRYVEVVKGKQSMPDTKSRDNKIPFLFIVSVEEDTGMGDDLRRAIVVENSNVLDLAHTTSIIEESHINIKGMFTISPIKMVLLFNSVKDFESALEHDSVLWNLFDDVRSWTEGDCGEIGLVRVLRVCA